MSELKLIDGCRGRHRRGRRGQRAGRSGPCAPRPTRRRSSRRRAGRPGRPRGLHRLRRAGRVPGVRAGQRRAVRHLGRAERARASQAQEARGLSGRLGRDPTSRPRLRGSADADHRVRPPGGRPRTSRPVPATVGHRCAGRPRRRARGCPALLAALAAQTRRSRPVVAGRRHRLRREPRRRGLARASSWSVPDARVRTRARRTTGFGAAVRAALADGRAGARHRVGLAAARRLRARARRPRALLDADAPLDPSIGGRRAQAASPGTTATCCSRSA